MAITYVGGQTAGRVGAASTTNVTYALTGGTDSTPQAGDLVVLTLAVGSAGRNPAQAVTAPATFTSLGQLNPNTTTYDTCMNVSYKFMGGTPDTTFTAPSTGNAQDAQRWTVQVFRGVDSTTPLDVAAVSAIGTATGRPNPASITPVTAGAYVLICGAGAAATGAAYTAPANYTTNFLTGTTADTNDVMIGSGYRAWTSGAEDPAAYTGGTANAVDSWAAYTIALRPQGVVTHAATGALVGSGAVVAGTAKKNVPHAATGALVGPGAVVAGTAARAAPTIRPILISTTVWEQDTLGTSGTPGAKSITVPADAQAVVVHFHMGSGGSNALSISSDFAGAFTIANSAAQNGCSLGYAVVSSTGAKNLTLSWTQTSLEGPSVYVSFIKNINTSDWVREVAVVGNDTNGTSATNVFDTGTDDLLLVVNDQDGGTAPTTISGFTSLATTGGTYSLPSRLQSCDSPGATTTTVTGTTTNFDVLSGISIKPGSVKPILISTTLWQQNLLGTSGTPGAKSITVPADAQAVVVQVASTMASVAPSLSISSDFAGTFTVLDSNDQDGCSIGYALVTSTGAKNLTLAWTESLLEGPSVYISFIKNIGTSDWIRATLAESTGTASGAISTSITSRGNDLVLAVDEQDGSSGTPSTMTGCTSLSTTDGTYGSASRLQYVTDPDPTSTSLTTNGTHYATLTAVAIKPSTSGPTTHVATGTLVGSGSAVAGSASRTRAHPSSGTLVGQGSTVTGSASRSAGAVTHDATGALVGSGSSVAGSANRFRAHSSTGALVGSGSTVTGAASRWRAFSSSGVLAGAGAVISGAAARTRQHNATGALIGSGSTLSGTAQHNVPHSSSGTLVGQGSTISGAASRNTTAVSHDATGALVGQGSTIAGSGTRYRVHTSSGALTGPGSSVSGAAQHNKPHAASGALVGPGSSVAGTANRFRSHNATGALVGQGSAVAGTARHNIPHASTGALIGQGASLAGAAVRSGGAITITFDQFLMIADVWQRLGLNPAAPLTETEAAAVAGTLSLAKTGALITTRTGASDPGDLTAMLLDIWQRLGLDPGNPMTATDTTIAAGGVSQTLTPTAGGVVVTRA